MNFDISDYYYKNTLCGLKIENEQILIFFGNKAFESQYQDIFPQYQFSFLKQVHGSQIVHTTTPFSKNVEADAQWTELHNIALVIQTADCLPVIITDKSFQKISALHAGWRGIENRIIPITLNSIFNDTPINVFIGPHILKQSFEVDLEVKEQLLKCTNPPNEEFIFNENLGKYFVDLKNISKLQMEESHRPHFYYHANTDTKSDLNLCSFRRDKKGAGRNISFIVKKSK